MRKNKKGKKSGRCSISFLPQVFDHSYKGIRSGRKCETKVGPARDTVHTQRLPHLFASRVPTREENFLSSSATKCSVPGEWDECNGALHCGRKKKENGSEMNAPFGFWFFFGPINTQWLARKWERDHRAKSAKRAFCKIHTQFCIYFLFVKNYKRQNLTHTTNMKFFKKFIFHKL